MIDSLKHFVLGCNYQPVAGTGHQILVCTHCREPYIPEHWR